MGIELNMIIGGNGIDTNGTGMELNMVTVAIVHCKNSGGFNTRKHWYLW